MTSPLPAILSAGLAGFILSRRCASARIAVVGLVSTIGLGGCASATLAAGSQLAKAGQVASAQMEQNATLSGDSIDTVRKAVAFNDGFNDQIGNAASGQFLSDITAVQARMGQYRNLFESLASSYAALGDLAGYDATGSFNSAIDSLSKDAQTFAAGVGASLTIPPTVTAGVKAAGAAIIASTQARRVKDGSTKIEVVLRQVIVVLDKSETRAKLIPAEALVAGQIDQAAVALFSRGVYSYEPLLESLGGPLGLKPTEKADEISAKDKKVQTGLRNVEVQMANARSRAVSAAYDRGLTALKALVPLHESLQHGAPLNLERIANIVGQLETLAASLKSSDGSTKPTGGR